MVLIIFLYVNLDVKRHFNDIKSMLIKTSSIHFSFCNCINFGGMADRQSWSAALNESQKNLNYRIIKTALILKMSPKMHKSFIDYQLCNHKVPIG